MARFALYLETDNGSGYLRDDWGNGFGITNFKVFAKKFPTRGAAQAKGDDLMNRYPKTPERRFDRYVGYAEVVELD